MSKSHFQCPKCGDVSDEEVEIYNPSIGKQSFAISPILPTCKR